ncbi:glycosyltransferase family 4 protein [Halovivax gelatinilyticus]|uniref:glycosyltransferase family 4 protein n=1 Tax=Halovivax gelatinilyticus TaxID=2961597 RepID=UPI0020CA380B|nr:glycosyltransferase family 4 protein [Halovivax gelatinilyticus]
MKVQAIVTTNRSSFFRQHVERLSKRGVKFTTVSASGVSLADINENEESINRLFPKVGHNLPYYAYISVGFYPRILHSSIKNDFDIIHSYSGLTLPFALAQPSRPLIVSFIGSDLMGDYLFGQFPKIAKLCANYADEVIVQNEKMDQLLDCKTHVLPNGVDIEFFRPIPRETAIDHVGWDKDKKHILFPYGTQRNVKNYDLAAKVGQIANREYVGEIHFHHLGDVRYQEMPYYMNAADVVLITSKREGSPNTVKEALACNTPVVSTDVGDVRERITDVQGASIGSSKQELVDGVISAIDTEECNGREQTRDVCWESVSNDLYKIYESAL